MAYLKNIVDFINDGLNIGLLNKKEFVNKLVIGIAQSMPKKNEDRGGVELLPSYVDNNGEGQYVGPDDAYDYMGYHKVNSIMVGMTNVNKGFGDERGYRANVVKMSYIVFGRRDRLQMSNEELAFYLQLNFPEAAGKERLKQLQLKMCNIYVNDIVLNDLQVFNEEFQVIEYFLKPEQFLFKVNYTIESAFDKKCFTTCCD